MLISKISILIPKNLANAIEREQSWNDDDEPKKYIRYKSTIIIIKISLYYKKNNQKCLFILASLVQKEKIDRVLYIVVYYT